MSRVPGSQELREGDDSPAALETTQTSIGDELARARPADPPGLLFAQARMAADLFGVGDAPGVGRFQLLNRLGAGGMGVIYAAYDPQLDRTVALKVVHVPGATVDSALAEGRALARLSHPNVVPIYDVGVTGAHLYIVMELVLGRTLAQWAKGRTQREIVKAYLQAGEALAAAHAAGLVHRDFKPDNAIMGNDGRVRVVDFGLACEAEDPDRPASGHRRGGTPKYMAPEQQIGAPITAVTDQYGFCTALAESLKERLRPARGGAALPRWLQAAIDRGAAPDPADRFASMADLLRVLSHDPVVVRRRRITGAVLAVAGVVAFVAGRSTQASRAEACNAGEARLAAVWGDGGRAPALARIGGLSDYGRSVQPRLERQLAEHAQRWAGGYRDACLAHAHGVQSDALMDRRMACLERGRAALTAVADLVRTADAKALPDLVTAAQALPDPDGCGDLQSLLANAEPPPAAISARVAELRGRMSAARVQIAAGKNEEARAIADAVAMEARSLGYRPLLAETLLVLGHATMGMEDRTAATPPLTEAFTLAFEEGDDSLAVEAWARRAWTRGTSADGPESLSGLDVVEAAAAKRSVSAFARALLYNNVGSVEIALDHRERARGAFEHALQEAKGVTGPGAAELLNVRVNLGFTIDDPERRDRVLEEAEIEKANALGADHPETLNTRWLRGRRLMRFARAAELLKSACAGLELHDKSRAMRCWSEEAYLRRELNDVPAAVAAMRRAESLDVVTDPAFPIVSPYLRLWEGDAVRASKEFTSALAAMPVSKDEPWWDRYERANLELGLARARRAMGQLREAKAILAQTLETLRDLAAKHSDGGVERRLGRARAELAEVLAALHAPPAEIAPHAEAAVAWLRPAGGSSAEIQELDRLAGRSGS
ncbi:MAG TPA: serine/threonine-protein kinase [Polyangia bacterium]|jgi:tetratricopeptide (TPR) repeat protein/predicted Ser/Thr protein kinase